MRKRYPSETHSNFFHVYGREWGRALMVEAQQRGMTRTGLIRQAVGDYLHRNPAPGDRRPRERNQPPQTQDR